MKSIKIYFILCLFVFCMAFNCKSVNAKKDLSEIVMEEYEEFLEGDYTLEEFKEMLMEKYSEEDFEEMFKELLKKIIVALFVGDAEVNLTPEEIEEMDTVINIVWDGTGDATKKTTETPSLSWVQENVEVYKESIYQENKTTAEVVVEQAAKNELDVGKIITGIVYDKTVGEGIDKVKDVMNEKALTKLLKDSKAVKRVTEKIDIASTVIDYINFVSESIKVADEPDALLRIWVNGGDLVADVAGGNVVWEFNSGLWNQLFEMEEYQQFVEVNKDNFGQAFVSAVWDGWVECALHIPEEMGYLAEDFTKLCQGFKEGWGLLDWLRGKIKPTQYVNVYKPNIYLYSNEPMDVDVKFTEEEWLTVTIPEYSLGWNTRLHGDGDITCQNEQYDFLFYESIASKALVVNEGGFVVTASDREEQLRDILALYEFNEEETEDFIEFWMEMLEADVDYVMYPQDTARVDEQMPIVITPEPEKITRLWFAFEIYDGQEVSVPQITPIVREGFTVVEWGGFFLD